MHEIDKIKSRDNARLVHIRKVRDGKMAGEIFLEGSRLVEEALRSDVRLLECVLTAAFGESERSRSILNRLSSSDVRVSEIPEPVLKSIADTANPQGIILTAERPAAGFDRMPEIAPTPGLFVYLYEINDPSNLGAVLRSAEAAGVSGVILSPRSADPFSPKALRAGMGSNLRVPVWENADLTECFKWSREKGIRIAAADVSGTKSYTDLDWTSPSIVAFGSEAHGLDPVSRAAADEIFRIPMKNGVESLNLAVSAGIVFFEAVRQNSEGS